jgi:hypothetical protein
MIRYFVIGVVGMALVGTVGFIWTYTGRLQLVRAQRLSCLQSVSDRRSDILVRATQAWATQRVADDPLQPLRTREVRRIEAAQDRASVRDRLTRIDTASVEAIVRNAADSQIWRLVMRLDTGRRLDCSVEYPDTKIWP